MGDKREERTTASGPPPVLARGLTKRYGTLLAVDGLDLEVPAGAVFGFLGPNGAGKTTTLRMMLGLIKPTAGTVELFGLDPWREGARALAPVAGFVEAPRFYPYLSALENLRMLAAFDGRTRSDQRIEALLELVELTHAAKQKVGSFSHGMGQRLGIAAALLREPKLLVLDEPTTGLDPAGIRDMRLLIQRLNGEGITVLLSSHQLAEVQEVCTDVAIVRSGKIVFSGSLQELRNRAHAYRLRSADQEATAALIERQPSLQLLDRQEGELVVAGSEQAIGALTVTLGQAGIPIYQLTGAAPTVEELFFALTEEHGHSSLSLPLAR